jgi:hypothetical protein
MMISDTIFLDNGLCMPASCIPEEFKRRDPNSITADEWKEIAGYHKRQEQGFKEKGKELERKITVLEAKAGVYGAMAKVLDVRAGRSKQ